MKRITLDNSQTIADQVNNKDYSSDTLLEIKSIPNTPFGMVRMEDGYFIALGNTRITEIYDNEETLEKLVTEKHWDIILNCIIAITQINKQ